AKDLLRDTGSIFVRCDYNGNWIVRPLMDEIFGRENFRNEIVVRKGKRTESRERSKFETVTESLFFYSLNKEKLALNIPMRSKPKDEQKWTTMFFSEERGDPIRTFWGIVIKAPKGCHWQFSQERIESEISKGNIKIVCKNCGWEYTNTDVNATITECIKCGSKEFEALYLRREVPLNNDWTDIPGYTYIVSKSTGFTTENSEIILKRVIESTSREGDIIMDFFLGSGTTVAVAHKLGRRWIGIEVGDHFYTVILPRMKKVFAYDKSGISKEEDVKKKYNQKKAGGFLKYYELESFEDILKNFLRLHEENCLNLQDGCMHTVDGINFWLKADYIYALYRASFININSNEDKIDLNIRDIYPDKSIDLPETISNLLGSPILKITKEGFILHNGESIHTNHININLIKPLLGI
ncbi:MAG: site-specific DNA-methyltransferase, partial [Desulfurococcaceae archaeon]